VSLKTLVSGLFESFASKDAEWTPHVVNNVASISGDMISGCVMRRNIDGKWQYREMTHGELRSWTDAHL
jgi:hypothetical protein